MTYGMALDQLEMGERVASCVPGENLRRNRELRSRAEWPQWQGGCYMVFCKVEPPALLRPVPRLEHMEQLGLERVRGI